MSARIRRSGGLVLAGLLAAAPARAAQALPRPQAPEGRIVARIGDQAIDEATFAEFVLEEQGASPLGTDALDWLVQGRIVEAEAKARGLSLSDGEIDERLAELDRKMRESSGGKRSLQSSLKQMRDISPEEFRAVLVKSILAQRMMGDDFGLPAGSEIPPEKQSLWFRDARRPPVKREQLPPGVVAEVAGLAVTRTEWGRRLFGQFQPKEQEELFQDFVGIQLLLKKGRELHLEVTPAMIRKEVDERTATLKKTLEEQGLSTQGVDYLSTIRARGADPDVVLKSDRLKAEILLKEITRELHGRDGFRAYYDAHRDSFDKEFGRRVRLSTIFLAAGGGAKGGRAGRSFADAERELDRIKDRLQSDAASLPAQFSSLARLHSEDPVSMAAGGDLGFLGAAALEARQFPASLMDEPAGRVVGPVQSIGGVHLLLVGEKKAASPFEEIRDQVEKAARRDLLTQLRKDVKIERNL